MKLLINGYNLRDTPAGIANVVINFVNSLIENTDNSIELIVSPKYTKEINDRIKKSEKLKIIKTGSENSLFWLMFSLKKEINKRKPDLLWSPSPLLPFGINKKTKKLITVNDFVSRDYRNTMTLNGKLITFLLEKKTIKNADYLWSISEYTKQRIEDYYKKRKCKKIFVGCAPEPSITKIDITEKEKNDFLSKLNISKKFILFVGSLEPRKNLSFLLNVFENYHKRDSNIQLVIVGARKWGTTNISDIIYREGYPKEDAIFTPFLSEKELCSLYNLAICYVSTSLNEGFGLPQVEAMQCECPVVTAHNSAMIEVVEGAGLTVKGWDINEWCDAIEFSINNKSEIVLKQNSRIKQYRWTIITQNLINYLDN